MGTRADAVRCGGGGDAYGLVQDERLLWQRSHAVPDAGGSASCQCLDGEPCASHRSKVAVHMECQVEGESSMYIWTVCSWITDEIASFAMVLSQIIRGRWRESVRI